MWFLTFLPHIFRKSTCIFMVMRNKILWFLLFILPIGLCAQEIDGKWVGWLSQDGKKDTFYYEINIAQNGDGISGVAFSSLNQGKVQARFVLSGVKQGGKIVIQEVKEKKFARPTLRIAACAQQIVLRQAERSGIHLYFHRG